MLLELTASQTWLTQTFIGIFGIILFYFYGFFLAASVTFYFLTGNRPTTLFTIISTLPRDLKWICRFNSVNSTVSRWLKNNMGAGDIFEETSQRFPNKIAFIMENEQITFSQANKFCYQVASYFKTLGYKKGDCIGLLLETRIEYPLFWVGLSKIGVITAMININQRKQQLLHSLKLVNCKAIIVSSELIDVLADVRDHIKDLKIFQFNSQTNNVDVVSGATNLREQLDTVAIQTNLKDDNFSPKDILTYVFTSGTTGLPKAVVINHIRYMYQSLTCTLFNVQENDIVYAPLPLYHGAGGFGAVGLALNKGVTVVLRKKFSASNYWKDCIKYNCTVAEYIGEMCRYLLLTPPKVEDKMHKVKIMIGNGIKPQIWKQFAERFGVSKICELYASTEGNCNMFNLNHTPGVVGFYPKCLEYKSPIALIKCDNEGAPIRDVKGSCIRCNVGEQGLLIGKIKKNAVVGDFTGYTDKEATEKKIIHNAFEKGDSYYNTGDILIKDLLNNFSFVDRTGDTYRWRGENTACSEVEGVINNLVGLNDCTVYGVEVPHCEGKAGMAAIVDPEKQLDLQELSFKLKECLPIYARPLFIRILPCIPLTGTFKMIKRDLLKETFNIKIFQDPIYFLHKDGIYRKFEESDYANILGGKANL